MGDPDETFEVQGKRKRWGQFQFHGTDQSMTETSYGSGRERAGKRKAQHRRQWEPRRSSHPGAGSSNDPPREEPDPRLRNRDQVDSSSEDDMRTALRSAADH